MRTGTLAALFVALLAMVHGEDTNTTGDAISRMLKSRDAALKKPKLRNNFRGAPPCGETYIRPPKSSPTPGDIIAARQSAKAGAKYPSGSKPTLCSFQYVNCVRYPTKLEQHGGSKELVRWTNNGDHTTLVAYLYWQASISFKTDGGSAKVYIAHGSVWACVNGILSWKYDDDNISFSDRSKEPEFFKDTRAVKDATAWKGACHCGFNLNTDLTLTIS